MILVDSHADLAWNVLTLERDYSRSAYETREIEAGTAVPTWNGNTMFGYPEWLRARVGVIFATLFAAPIRYQKGEWDTQCYSDQESAHRLYMDQVGVYRRMFDQHPKQFQPVLSRSDLDSVIANWSQELPESPAIGLVLLMEGADGVQQPSELEMWYEAGIRFLGLSWKGTRYAGGTGAPGGLTPAGRELLGRMSDLGITLDLSHLAEKAVYEALNLYHGKIIASHANPRRIIPNSEAPDRHLNDEVIQLLAERDGVIGIVPYNHFLKGDWLPTDGREQVGLDWVAAQIDYVCQLTGSSRHVGIGTDFDGGFGLEMTPEGLDSVADLGLIGSALQDKGFAETDVAAVMGGNWIRFLQQALPVG
jgi:membrane dipeptidase